MDDKEDAVMGYARFRSGRRAVIKGERPSQALVKEATQMRP